MAFGDDALESVLGDADSVAQHLYNYATESAPGSVDADIATRIARKTGYGEDLPYRSYEARRQRLSRDYSYQPGSTQPSSPTTGAGSPLDFSSEGVPVNTTAKKPDVSAEPAPVEPTAPEQPEPTEPQEPSDASPAPMVGGFPAV